MMNTLKLNGLTDGQLKIMLDWARQYGIEAVVVNDNAGFTTPVLNTKVKDSKKPSNNKDFPELGKPDETVKAVNRYGKLIRYWENGFVVNKVKYGIKMALKEAGATWNKEQGAFEFKTLKDAKAFMQAQKARG